MATFIVTQNCNGCEELGCLFAYSYPVTTNQSAETQAEAEELVKRYFELIGYKVFEHIRTRERY